MTKDEINVSLFDEVKKLQREIDLLRADAARWREYASSPQTALMLGTKLDPNDKNVDWIAECGKLADAILLSSEADSKLT